MKRKPLIIAIVAVCVMLGGLIFLANNSCPDGAEYNWTESRCIKPLGDGAGGNDSTVFQPITKEDRLIGTKFDKPAYYDNGIPVTEEGYELQQLPSEEQGWAVKVPLRKP